MCADMVTLDYLDASAPPTRPITTFTRAMCHDTATTKLDEDCATDSKKGLALYYTWLGKTGTCVDAVQCDSDTIESTDFALNVVEKAIAYYFFKSNSRRLTSQGRLPRDQLDQMRARMMASVPAAGRHLTEVALSIVDTEVTDADNVGENFAIIDATQFYYTRLVFVIISAI